MKIRSAVVGVHVAALCAFTLTQGCLTTGSDKAEPVFRHKAPFTHVHKGKTQESATMVQPETDNYRSGLGNQGMLIPSDSYLSTDLEPIPQAAAVATTEVYIVRKGDTLSQLAADFDTTTAELVRLNNLTNPDVLYVGQEITVPAGRRASSGAPATIGKPDSLKKGGSYIIQKGDTLSEIAVAAGVSIDDLRKLNSIQGDKIMAGETLDIPAGGKVPSKVKKTATKTATTTKSEKKKEITAVETAPATSSLTLPAIAPATEDEVEAAPATAVAPEGTAPSSYVTLEVRVLYPGETIDDIAREYGVSKAEIMRATGISDESQVREGMRLNVPVSQ